MRWLAVLVSCAACAHAPSARHDCGAIANVDAVLQPASLVIFGEMHGTNEIPAFLGDVACAASLRFPRVHVGLELSGEEGGLWTEQFQSGRTSVAMRELIGRLKALGADVFWFDSTAQDRDGAMADRISEERRRAPGDLFLVLVGNLHARKKPGAPWDPQVRWMATRLAEREPRLVTLDVRYLAGSAWICQTDKPESCGETPLRGRTDAASRGIALAPQAEGYDGTFSVGAISASPPDYLRRR